MSLLASILLAASSLLGSASTTPTTCRVVETTPAELRASGYSQGTWADLGYARSEDSPIWNDRRCL